MSDDGRSYRDILDIIIPYAREDKRIVLLVCDMGFGVADNFKKEFPDRIFNMGIMEQGTVGIAAGMSISGLIPIVYSIVNFLAYRSFEQIRNDVVLQGLNVKFIATGVNNYFKFLGPSHCCGEDDKKIMKLINMRIFDPYERENVDFNKMVKEWITDTKAGYIRVGNPGSISTPLLSIIMPALNEEKNIAMAISDCLKAMEDYNINGEIIVVNDGSADKTSGLVNDFIKKDNRISIINHDSPKGIAASFWDGVNNSNGDIVIMIPGDNENDPWEILRYYKFLDHVDIVIPFVFNKDVRSIYRNVLSFIYRFIINTTFLVNLNYTNGTVIYRKSILNEIDHRSFGFFFQTDILIRAVKRGYLFAEVPYKLNFRNAEISKALTFPSLWRVINGYIQLVKDIYYNKQGKNLRRHFASDSLTFKRYNQ